MKKALGIACHRIRVAQNLGNRMKATALSLLLVGVSGAACATTARRLETPEPKPEVVDNRSYNLGEAATCFVGEPLITRQVLLKTTRQVGVSPDRRFVIKGGLGPASVNFSGGPEDVFAYYGRVGKQRAYQIPNHHHGYLFGVNDDGRFTGTVGGWTYGHSPIVGMNQYSISPPVTRFTQVESYSVSPLPDGRYIHNELLYSGRTASEMRLLYREYTPSGMARPAFTQDLVFPVDAQKIRVKNYEIVILEARADGLKFKVISDAGK